MAHLSVKQELGRVEVLALKLVPKHPAWDRRLSRVEVLALKLVLKQSARDLTPYQWVLIPLRSQPPSRREDFHETSEDLIGNNVCDAPGLTPQWVRRIPTTG